MERPHDWLEYGYLISSNTCTISKFKNRIRSNRIQFLIMLFCSDKSFLFCFLCISTSFSDSSVSVYFKRKTNLYFRREIAVISDYVLSLTECAMKCVCKNKCVSFFYNHLDFRCQLGGKTYVSFADSSTDPWKYYGKDH